MALGRFISPIVYAMLDSVYGMYYIHSNAPPSGHMESEMERTPSDFLRERTFPEPADLADVADAIEAENSRMAAQNAPSYIKQDEFWADLFDDLMRSEPPTFLDLPLAECMKNLKDACEGRPLAILNICRALHQIERQAIPLAEQALKRIYDVDN